MGSRVAGEKGEFCRGLHIVLSLSQSLPHYWELFKVINGG